MRCDSRVVEADIRYPTDAGLASDAVRTLARAARKLRAAVPDAIQHVRDRTRSANKRLLLADIDASKPTAMTTPSRESFRFMRIPSLPNFRPAGTVRCLKRAEVRPHSDFIEWLEFEDRSTLGRFQRMVKIDPIDDTN